MNNYKKYVGNLSGFLNNPKKELNKKQDTMKALSAQDVRNMIPKEGPTEEQIIASKQAPIQITIVDSESNPVTSTEFSIKKDNVEKTSGITNDTGLCIYEDPNIMDVSVMLCSLEYEDKSVSLEVPEDATYASIEVSEDINGEVSSEVIDTDGGMAIGSSTDLDNWNYIIADDHVTLAYYKGSEKDVTVYAKYEKDGVIYNTRIRNGNPLSKGTKAPYMFNADGHNPCRYIESITFNKGIDMSPVYYMNRMFYNCTNLKTINGLLDLNVSNVHEMSNVFYQCGALTSLDLSTWNTSNVVNMTAMFMNCNHLTSVNLANLDTSNVTTIANMFKGCFSLENVDLSNWDTSNVTNMSEMFNLYTAYSSAYIFPLSTIDLSSFDTSNVTSMKSMFNSCKNLTEIKVSRNKWVISSGCSTSGMFNNCGVSEVTYID